MPPNTLGRLDLDLTVDFPAGVLGNGDPRCSKPSLSLRFAAQQTEAFTLQFRPAKPP